jgi:hypothetical protein
MSRVLKALFVFLLAIVALLPLYSNGTGDVLIWQGWIQALERDGFITGYIPVYPPLTWALLQVVAFSYHALNIDMFLAIKLSLVVFLLLTSGVFLLWTRNLLLTAFLHLSLVLSSVALGYLDIWFALPLLLAFWALKERKIFLFSLFFTVSCLIKWQPLIIAPFLLLYVLRLTGVKQWKVTLKVFLRDMALPAGLLLGAMLLLFGQGLLLSMEDSIHVGLTGNALNYNWLVTWFLCLTQPERFGALADGVVNYIGITDWLASDWPIVVVPRIIFGLFYVSTLLVFARRARSFKNLLRFAILGYLAYFTFNVGVHENHLFLAGLLVVVLYWLSPRDLYTALIVVLMANINLFLFYGVSGGYPYQRVIGIDVSVPLALFNVVFFLAFWAMTCWPGKPAQPIAELTP